MNDKKRDIIFEVPKAELPSSVRDLMAKAEAKIRAADEVAEDLLGEPLEIDLHIKNSKVIFSLPANSPDPVLAKLIIRAVQEYEVKPVAMKPRTVATAQLGAPMVKCERYVRIDWKKKTISTNFPPEEGSTFLSAMAVIVEALQGTKPDVEPTS